MIFNFVASLFAWRYLDCDAPRSSASCFHLPPVDWGIPPRGGAVYRRDCCDCHKADGGAGPGGRDCSSFGCARFPGDAAVEGDVVAVGARRDAAG